MMDSLSNLYRFDLWMLHKINVEWSHPALDSFWTWVTDLHKTWWFLPILVPMLLLWAVYIYRFEVWKPVLWLGVAVGVSDAVCYRLVKAYFQRPRPFRNEEIASWLRHVGEAGGYSFPSNHAANVFSGAMILAWYFPRARYFFYTLASVVALSRVALGVHYPFDIIVGAGLGIFVGFLIRAFVLNQFRIFQPAPNVSNRDTETSSDRSKVLR